MFENRPQMGEGGGKAPREEEGDSNLEEREDLGRLLKSPRSLDVIRARRIPQRRGCPKTDPMRGRVREKPHGRRGEVPPFWRRGKKVKLGGEEVGIEGMEASAEY